MTNVSAITTTANSPTYLGMLVREGQFDAPFLSMVLGMGKKRREALFTFALNSNFTLEAASNSRTVSETNSMSFGTPTTYGKAQDTNVMQIEKRAIEVSEKRLAERAKITGVAASGEQFDALVRNELAFQLSANSQQLAVDMDYAIFNSTQVAESTAATNTKTGGLAEAISTNSTSASGSDFSEDLLNDSLQDGYDNGASINSSSILVCNPIQLKKIQNAVVTTPASRTEGGAAISRIYSPFAPQGLLILADKQVPQATMFILNMNLIEIVFLHLDGEQEIMYQPKERDAMSKGGILKSMWGLDYGNETKHIEITNLSTT